MSAVATPALRNQIQTALALRAARKFQDALDALTPAADHSPDYYTLRGEIQLALGRFQEAASSYFTVVASEPENVLAQFNLGVCLQWLSRWSEAALAFQKVLQLDASHYDARLGIGSSLLHLNRAEEALAHFDICWSDAGQTRALFGRAVALQMLRRHDEAEAAYQRLLETEINPEEVLSNLLALAAEVQDWDALQHYASRLLEISPLSLPALKGFATVALERGQFETAVHYCGRIVERSPECVEAWHNLRYATGRVMSALRSPQQPHRPA